MAGVEDPDVQDITLKLSQKFVTFRFLRRGRDSVGLEMEKGYRRGGAVFCGVKDQQETRV